MKDVAIKDVTPLPLIDQISDIVEKEKVNLQVDLPRAYNLFQVRLEDK